MATTDRRSTFHRFCVVLAALVFVLAACASGDEAASEIAPDPAPTAAAPSVSSEASGDAAEAGASPTRAPTPEESLTEESAVDTYVSPIFGAIGVDFDRLPELDAERVEQVERLTAECMLERGFEYTPQRSAISPSAEARWELEANLTEEEFTRTYGYGIATLFGEDYRGDGVLRFVEQFLGPAPTTPRSAAEQEAFEIALDGRAVSDDTDEAGEQLLGGIVSEPGSCRYEADQAASNEMRETFNEFFSLLGAEFDALGARFDSDPRITEQRAEWQRCMAEGGHSYEEPFAIRLDIQDQADALGTALLSHPTTLQLLANSQDDELRLMSDADRLDYLDGIGVLAGFERVPELQAELDALAAFEIDVASMSWDCSDIDLSLSVYRELEEQFVEDHGDQLALLGAS